MGAEDDGISKDKQKTKGATTEQSKKEDSGPGSVSGLSSGRISRCSKAFKVLESQGFIVGKTLGSGSYAKVKSAYDIKRKHKVAIKIINKKKAFDEYLVKFLPREIDAMRTFGHHYALIKFYQIIETTSRHFFIMELGDGGDLLTEIKLRKHVDEEQAGIWFIHLHDGMKYMHGKGITHRDIKCENLVLNSENTLKITDFRFAKRIAKTKSGTPALSETYCGSYAYAPPEILKGTPYNPEMADVWSMGVVLFTMVYGRLPFDDGDHKKLLKQVQSRVVFPPKPEVSEQCRILMIKIFAKASDRVPLKNMKADAWFKLQQDSLKIKQVEAETKQANSLSVKSKDKKTEEETKCSYVVLDDTTLEDTANNNIPGEAHASGPAEGERNQISKKVDKVDIRKELTPFHSAKSHLEFSGTAKT